MAGFVVFGLWVVFNLAVVIPTAFFVFYTLHKVLPILAVVEDLDAPLYERIDLAQAIDEDDRSRQGNKAISQPRAAATSIRSMVRLIWSSRKFLSFCRGYGFFLAWNLVKGLSMHLAYKLPSFLGFLVQIFLPLACLQLHILWIHKLVASRNVERFWKRFVPAKKAFKAAGLPMLIFLIAEVATQRIMIHTYRSMGMKWENFLPLDHIEKSFWWWLLLAALNFVFVIPAQILLVRVEASLLSADEETIVPLDPALSAAENEGRHMTLIKAWKTFTRSSLANIIFLYIRIFFITVGIVYVVGAIDFFWYMYMALQSWRF